MVSPGLKESGERRKYVDDQKKNKGRITERGGDERLDGETIQKKFLAESKRGTREKLS